MPKTIRLSPAGKWYVGAVIAAGLTVILWSIGQMYRHPPKEEWLILAALTLLTGSFTVKIPKLAARLSVSDAFVFASVLLFGSSVATVIVAFDCLVATLWLHRENRSPLRSLFNLASVAFAIWTAANVFYAVVPTTPGTTLVLPNLLWPLLLLATTFFLMNTGLVALALAFEHRANIFRLWKDNFAWLSLNYFGGVSVAALLVSYTQSIDLVAVSVILPLLVILYLTYRTSTARVVEAQRYVDQVEDFYMSAIETLAMAVDAKDQITHGHIRRVQVYATELAKYLGVTDDRQQKAIAAAALLHDMGKLAIPEHILNKPGKLTSVEFEKMKRHSDIGADLLSSVKFPYPVVPIVRHHHEHWDGTGYPAGIAGPDIPLGARILAVVDCFDALTSDRPYRPRLSHEEAFRIIRERKSTMYDPLVVDAFIRAYPEIAPAAITAGQEARSIVDASFLGHPSSADTAAPLTEIRANAVETAVIDRCGRDISKATSVTSALQVAAQGLRQLTPATVYALFEYDGVSDSLSCHSAVGDEQRMLDGLTIRVGERVTGWSAANLRTSINSDASLDLGHIAQFFEPSLRSTLSACVSDGERLLAVLTAYSCKESPFTESHKYAVEQITVSLFSRLSSIQANDASNVLSYWNRKA